MSRSRSSSSSDANGVSASPLRSRSIPPTLLLTARLTGQFTRTECLLRTNFADGLHTLTVFAVDNVGNATVSSPVTFRTNSAGVLISGQVLNYKNPFKSRQGRNDLITYMLSTDSDISIYIQPGRPADQRIFVRSGRKGATPDTTAWSGTGILGHQGTGRQ